MRNSEWGIDKKSRSVWSDEDLAHCRLRFRDTFSNTVRRESLYIVGLVRPLGNPRNPAAGDGREVRHFHLAD